MKQGGNLTIVFKSIQHLEGFLICHFLLTVVDKAKCGHNTCSGPQAALVISTSWLAG